MCWDFRIMVAYQVGVAEVVILLKNRRAQPV